jgi:hypothetical protein
VEVFPQDYLDWVRAWLLGFEGLGEKSVPYARWREQSRRKGVSPNRKRP